jgi:hypothetical protein
MRGAAIILSAVTLGLAALAVILFKTPIHGVGGECLGSCVDGPILVILGALGLAGLAMLAAVVMALVLAGRERDWVGLVILLLGTLAAIAGPLSLNSILEQRPCGPRHSFCVPNGTGGIIPGIISILFVLPLLTLLYALLNERRTLQRIATGVLAAVAIAIPLVAALL